MLTLDVASCAVFEAPAVIAGLDDIAVGRKLTEQLRCYLGAAEGRRSFGKGEVGRDDNRGALVEPADQVEQQLSARLRERQVAEFVENDEIDAHNAVGDAALPADLDSLSSLLAGSTTLKRRALRPARMHRRATPIRCPYRCRRL